MLQELVKDGDTAAAWLGHSCQFKYTGHYDLESCRKYLEMAVEAENPVGQYLMGSMMMTGDPPFEVDKVQAKYLLEEAKKQGNEDAAMFLQTWYTKLTPRDVRRMMVRSGFIVGWEEVKRWFRWS